MATLQIPEELADVVDYLGEDEKAQAVKVGLRRVLMSRRGALSRKIVGFRERYGEFARFERQLPRLARGKDDSKIERDYFEWVNAQTALGELDRLLKRLRA